MSNRYLILGTGYLGRRIGARLLESGSVVYGLTRSTQNACILSESGWCPVVGDICQDASMPQLPDVDYVVYAIGYQRGSDYSRRDLHVAGVHRVLSAIPQTVRRIVWLSSTGVFGASQGELVDELTPCHPMDESGATLLEFESLVRASSWFPRSAILRLAGLYGPGRIPRASAVESDRGEEWLNLVHVEDAATAVCLTLHRATTPCLYLVSDNQPVRRRDFARAVDDILGPTLWSSPGFGSTIPSSRRTVGRGHKRVVADKIRNELGLIWRYPNYADGLRDIARQMRHDSLPDPSKLPVADRVRGA